MHNGLYLTGIKIIWNGTLVCCYLSVTIPQMHQKFYSPRYLWISVCGPSRSLSEVNANVWTFFSPEGQRFGRPSDRLRSVYLSNPQHWPHIPLSLRGRNQAFRSVWITVNTDYSDGKLYRICWLGGCVGVKKYPLPVSGGICFFTADSEQLITMASRNTLYFNFIFFKL